MTERAGPAITMYATSWCPYCRRASRLLDEVGIAYTWVDIDRDKRAADMVMKINGGDRTVPTILLPGGATLVAPDRRALVDALRACRYQVVEPPGVGQRLGAFLRRLVGRSGG